jgi:Ca2+-binding RTX toxin-like protein
MSHSFEVFGANAKANKLVGTATQDRIYGLNGNDTISGKGGSDLLSGGLGSDTLTGGNGKDTFYFDNLQKKADVITDFTRGKDTIGLDADIFTALPAGDWSHGTFKVGRAFGADTHLLYRSSTGQLFYDADGSGTNDTAHLITTLENHAKLIYSDFELL